MLFVFVPLTCCTQRFFICINAWLTVYDLSYTSASSISFLSVEAEASRKSTDFDLGSKPSTFVESDSNMFQARLKLSQGELTLKNGHVLEAFANAIEAFVVSCILYSILVSIMYIRKQLNLLMTTSVLAKDMTANRPVL